MEKFKKLIDAVVSFYNTSDQAMQFGMILIACIFAVVLLIATLKFIFWIFRRIIPSKQKNKHSSSVPKAQETSRHAAPAELVYNAKMSHDNRSTLYLDEEMRKIKSKLGSIPMEELKEESPAASSKHTINSLSLDKYSRLSEKKKKDIKKSFANLSLKELKKQRAIYAKKQENSDENVEKASLAYRALLSTRDQAQNECATRYEQHRIFLVQAKTSQNKVVVGSKDLEDKLSLAKEEVESKIREKDRLLEELEGNKKALSDSIITAGEIISSAHVFASESKKEFENARDKYRAATAEYLASVSELNTIENDLFNYLQNFSNSAKESAESAFALSCLNEAILAEQAVIDEQKRQEAEEAARIKQEKEAAKAEAERLKREKKEEEERKAKEQAEAEQKAKEEALQKKKEQELAILLSKQEMKAANEKAQSALSKADELDKRAEALEEEKAAIEAQKRAIADERERKRANKEAKKAAAKAEKAEKLARAKAEKAAREKAELEALEDLTEEEKELRREVEKTNSEFASRSSEAAQEGFVNEKRIREIKESKATLESEQAKRIAEKEALRRATDQNQQRIIDNSSVLTDGNDSLTEEERMEAIRAGWRLERENKERFEEEQARKAREIEERRQALANNNSNKN